ncbi:hypothetical protein [uncultured Pseudomonas sp.]|uniref:hypothetical protein n=1 Tax=uncultured Pseudomonas sp. TaxID=114707 RepID=UPI002588E000|nr:hypothetical protein [uncultured Pseudomonas sp.]
MPTENRSSNTEMVSVPRHLVLDAITCAWDHDSNGNVAALQNWLDQPAAQPHPDPIAWMVGTAFWWTKEEAERDAAETGLPVVPVGPLSGGVEAEQLREVIKHSDAQIMRQSMRISNQRAQLAKRNALLDRVVDHANFWHDHPYAEVVEGIARDYKALSAIAEPSALPDPLGCNECTHAGCGKFDGPRQLECRAMADNACARPGASS